MRSLVSTLRTVAWVTLAACGKVDTGPIAPPTGPEETGPTESEPTVPDTEETAETAETAVETESESEVVPPPVRTCASTITYEDAATTVYFASEVTGWDEPSWIPLTSTGGGFAAEVDVYGAAGQGVYCYKLIVDGVWQLDPSTPYRAYCDGTENSGLRVEACAVPAAEVVAAGATGARFEATIQGVAAADGAPLVSAAVTRRSDFVDTVEPASFDPSTGLLTVDLDGLPIGKHTLSVTFTDAEGRASEPALLPFWVEADEPFVWNDALIYMVMLDRYADGDPGNNPPPEPTAAAGGDWQGGDLQGLTERIESGYLDALGVRAIWLTPFNTGASGAEIASDGVHVVTGYHGYWPIAPREVDPRLGTDADLRAMVSAAHARGIRVLMDSVVNHVHEDHPYYRDHPDWFNDGCTCGTPGCDWTAEALTCLFAPYMPDIDWQNREASEQFIADVLWWLEAYDLDGARIDAVKHVDAGAVFNLVTRINERFETAGTDYYLDGETAMGWSGDDLAANADQYGTINRYLGPDGLDGQFDFVLYHAVVDNVFVHQSKGMIHLDVWTGHSQTQYLPGSIMTPYVGSHDTSRLVSMIDYDGSRWDHPDDVNDRKWVEDGLPVQPGEDEVYDRARVALCWLLTQPGAPMLYQGDEYGEFGGNDPDNRHMHRVGAALSAREASLLADVSRVGAARQELRPLRRGDYRGIGSTEDVMVFARSTAEGSVVVAINRASFDATAYADLGGLGFPDGLLGNSLGLGGGMVSSSGWGTVTAPARSCAVFAP